jgi:hypothetical protein
LSADYTGSSTGILACVVFELFPISFVNTVGLTWKGWNDLEDMADRSSEKHRHAGEKVRKKLLLFSLDAAV